MPIELKSCPFCGCESEHGSNPFVMESNYQIRCIQCEVKPYIDAGTMDAAFTAWNKRAAPSADQGELVDRVLNRSSRCTVTDGNGSVHSAIKVKEEDAKALCAALQSAEAGRKDAARYAWLKERCEWRSLGVWRSLKLPEVPFSDGPRNSNAPDELDAAIDAAIAGK